MAKTKTKKVSGLDRLAQRSGYRDYTEYLQSAHWQTFRETYRNSGLPLKCIACGYPRYSLHHRRYESFGREKLGDVLPLCSRCHRETHELLAKKKMPAWKTHYALQTIFEWTEAEMWAKFECFKPHWQQSRLRIENRKNEKAKHARGVRSPRDSNDYYKISKHFRDVVRYIKDGYTVEQVAKMYDVGPEYVRQWMAKYPDYFKA